MSPRAQPASFTIRPAGPTDALVVAALHEATSTETWSAKSVIDIMGLPSMIARLAFGGPAAAPSPAGFVLALAAADQAEIVSIGVVPAWRRHGVGRALLAAAGEAAQSRGAYTLFLDVAADNTAALALYRRAGVRPVG
ncbi:MAG: GNAT family N-acetyltransferase, partial [Alphaproteobacteria bacterium]